MKTTAIHRLRLVSMPEGVSFVLLLLCTYLKYNSSFNAVPVLGPLHGCLFVAYAIFALLAWREQGWSFGRFVWIMALSVIPFGGLYAERVLGKEEKETAPAMA